MNSKPTEKGRGIPNEANEEGQPLRAPATSIEEDCEDV